MDGGNLPGFYPTRVNFFVYNRYGGGGMVLADVFDARFGVVAFSAPRLSPRGGATIAMPFHGIVF